MTLRAAHVPLLCTLTLAACGPARSSADSSGSTSDSDTNPTDTGSDSGYGDCPALLGCIAAVLPDQQAQSEAAYGPMSSCWSTSAAARDGCLATCTSSLTALQLTYPDEPACGGTAPNTSGTASDPTSEPTTADPDAQLPPQGHDAIEAWLAEGHYKRWACQPAPHGPLKVSPHGMQRICSNQALSSHPPDGGEYPVGAASVKELYDAAGTTLVGYAVSLHTKPGTDGGDWYWYERVPLDHPAMPDAQGVVADGSGDSGRARDLCVSCHIAAGLDADHPGHDFVYVQVQ